MSPSALRVAALWAAGVTDTAELAAAVKVSHRQVCRILTETLKVRPKRVVPADVTVRAARLLLEGMPASWVFDDAAGRCSYEYIVDLSGRLPGHAERVREWRRVWQSIATKPHLLERHYEIAPPTIHSRLAVAAA